MINSIHLGPLTIHMYGLMIATGYFAALILCRSRRKKFNLDDDVIWGIFYCALFGGMLGAKLLYIIIDIPKILAGKDLLLSLKSGYVVYGGILGGIITARIYCKRKNCYFLKYSDSIAPCLSLAQFFGRIGCFFAGCCYGIPTESKFSIEYSISNIAPNGVKLFPVQLVSAAGDLLICLILLKLSESNRRRGTITCLWFLLYSAGRFVIEFFRSDNRGTIGMLSTSQFISVFVFIIGIYLLIKIGYIGKSEYDDWLY